MKTQVLKYSVSLNTTEQVVALAIKILERAYPIERALRAIAAYFGYRIEKL